MPKRHKPLLTAVRDYGARGYGFDSYTNGRRKQHRHKSRRKAVEEHFKLTQLIAKGRLDLLEIDPVELAEFRKYKAALGHSRSLGEAHAEFLSRKATSHSNYTSNKSAVAPLLTEFEPETQMGSITTPMLQRLLDSQGSGSRRKYNLLAAWKALWRYEQRQGYLPQGLTAPQRVEPVPRLPGKVNVLTPDQIRLLLDNVKERYLPWLAIGLYAGVRSEEIAPRLADVKSGRKSPLMWEDFKWEQGFIFVRRETAKTGRRKNPQPRTIPIFPALAEWLAPYRFAKGRVCDVQNEIPTQGETKRLGKLLGGWPHNCLRDTFISYQIALTNERNLVAKWAGNSEAMIAQSYEELMPLAVAKEYAEQIRPKRAGNVIAVDKSQRFG